MADWWKRLMKPAHSPEASEALSQETQVHVQKVREGRIELERLLNELQEKRKQADG